MVQNVITIILKKYLVTNYRFKVTQLAIPYAAYDY